MSMKGDQRLRSRHATGSITLSPRANSFQIAPNTVSELSASTRCRVVKGRQVWSRDHSGQNGLGAGVHELLPAKVGGAQAASSSLRGR